MKLVRNAKHVEIKNICGSEAHLRKIENLGQNQVGDVEFLTLEFDDEEGTQDSRELARQYMEVFRQYFPKIQRLEIETIGDRNFTLMLELMMADSSFPWFDNVHTIDCYQIRNLRDMNIFKLFLTKFKNLTKLNGIIEEEFNPLEQFIREGKRVKAISWTYPEREAQRKEL